MKLCRVSDLFRISKPQILTLQELEEAQDGIPVVSASAANNGVALLVKENPRLKLFKRGSITAPMKGIVLLACLQPRDFYCLHQIAVLESKRPMTDNEKLYYCLCLRANAYRFSFGRQVDRTLQDLLIPSEVPDWVNKVELPSFHIPKLSLGPIDTSTWQWFNYTDLFEIKRGTISKVKDEGQTPVITATSMNNGLGGYIDEEPTFPGNVITVSGIGTSGEAFYQSSPFCASVNVNVLTPLNFKLTTNAALFLCSLIKLEKFKYSYGYNLSLGRMKKSKIKLPVDKEGKVDWKWIEEKMTN